MKIAIIGSRRRDGSSDHKALWYAFTEIMKKLKPDETVIIVSGGCPVGADYWAEDIAADLGLEKIIYKADWEKYGRAAGPMRNSFIAADADILIACVSYDRTGGTEDTIRKFKKLHPRRELIIV